MKKFYILLALLLVVFTSACTITGIDLPEINTDQLKGSGVSRVETRTVSGFTRVELAGLGEMTITQGDQESLTVEADDNILPYIITEVVDGTLIIRMKENFNIGLVRPINYTLMVKNLDGVVLSGFGNITMDRLTTTNLDIVLSGSGNMEMKELTAETLKAKLSGFGNLTIGGKVTAQDAILSGSGNYKGGGLQSDTAEVVLSGFGNATVWVNNTLDATLSGSGNLEYYGSPQIQQTVSGFGKINALGSK